MIGPAPSIEKAIELISAEHGIDDVLLDVNLRGEMAFPVEDALLEKLVPFVFMTGYNQASLSSTLRPDYLKTGNVIQSFRRPIRGRREAMNGPSGRNHPH